MPPEGQRQPTLPKLCDDYSDTTTPHSATNNLNESGGHNSADFLGMEDCFGSKASQFHILSLDAYSNFELELDDLPVGIWDFNFYEVSVFSWVAINPAKMEERD